jgi:predicted TIM-barrel fold metal-dependent hydrolase
MTLRLCDAHCHFFSSRFLEILIQSAPPQSAVTATFGALPAADLAAAVSRQLGWDPPGTPEGLADRWVAELDRHGIARASLIASIPGDEQSVTTAVARHPSRFVGVFMFNPAAPDAVSRLPAVLADRKLRVVALFPAMHQYPLDAPPVERVFEHAADHGAAVFVHCGVLSVGVRKKLGLPSPFDLRAGDPLAVARVAARFPTVPVIIPHFGAGLLREALMAADQCPNIHLDTSSSNSWMRYHPGLTLDAVFRQALAVAGPERLLFGTDSSFFPRGWQRPVYDAQMQALSAAGASDEAVRFVMGANFDRLLR